MKKSQKQIIFLLRLAVGWLFLYAGFSKVLDPAWTAAGFLSNVENFSGFYEWFTKPENIGWVDFLNQWGQVFIGAGLITGAFTRLASYFGILLMLLYYLPGLDFPYVEHGLLVEEHIVYMLVLVIFVEFKAGQYWGIDEALKKKFKLKDSWWF